MLFYNQVKGFGDSENMICRRGKQELAEEQHAYSGHVTHQKRSMPHSKNEIITG